MTTSTRVALVCAALWTAACTPPADRNVLRARTDSLLFEVSSEPTPPHARERTSYKVVVRDKESRQPIEGWEGQIFASTRDGANVYDPLIAGQELGTYYATLNYVVAGEWAVAIRMRRDSTGQFQRVDWMQDVLAERPNVP
ncbi:MAG TPA: hypothetical protein VJ596_06000 [Gemmatimonadaceae bacterium]|nr:hypothetical protein [Gemmatimonadaceae bacterium]